MDYATASALDAAIRDRVASAAAESSYSITELRRHLAYDRLLSRVFLLQPDEWVLKGGVGLLARIPEAARHSMDVDLYRATHIDRIGDDLAAAGSHGLGDHFSFDIEEVSNLTGLHPGTRYRVVAYLGDKEFARFPVDVVEATNMTAEPEAIAPLSPIQIDGLTTTQYRTYPIVDHIADKHAAMVGTYGDNKPSSRYRDLVDLVLIATTQIVDAHDLKRALESEYAYRGLDSPTRIQLPSNDWGAGYAAVATTVPNLAITNADDAIDLLQRFIGSILNETATGKWDPGQRRWGPS